MAILPALLLAACGGGGGGSASIPGSPPPVVFSGVAATGAPLAGATIRVLGANGSEACTTAANDKGEYRCTLAASAAAPFVIVADSGEQKLYSSAPSAQTGTVNVTPLTTLVVALLSPSGDPAKFADEVKADPGVAAPAKVETKVAQVVSMIAPLAEATGSTPVNPLTGSFAADGTGHDKLLDALQISVRPEATHSNIEVTIKVAPARNDAAPLAVAFRSDASTLPPPPAATIRPEDLAPDGVATLVADFLQRFQACYALPLAQRIANVPPGAVNAAGGAADVQAQACRTLFLDDDPASFRDNGFVVGAGLGFPGLFREASTGARFDRGNFEYRLANGDLFITFRSTTPQGAVAHSTLTVREQAGQLKAIGNQYAYDASVRPYIFDREFPLQPQFNYVGTGYCLFVANRVDAKGKPVFSEAVITTPTGREIKLRPMAARSFLGIVRANGTLSGTCVETFATAYRDASLAGRPEQRDTSLVVAENPMTDEQLRSIPNQGVWAIEFRHADPAIPPVTQVYRTIERASTIGEVRQLPFVQFTPQMKAQWLAMPDVQAFRGLRFGAPSATEPNVVRLETTGGGDAWLVPEGATAPISVGAFGSGVGGAFNDTENVFSTARTATVRCTKQSDADQHCDSSTGVTQFASTSLVNYVELISRTLRQQTLAKQIGLWRLPD